MRISNSSLVRIAGLAIVLGGTLAAQQQNFDNVQIRAARVKGNIYMLAGAGGNTTVQVGRDGVLMVDTQFAPLAQKIMVEVRKLNQGPLLWIINTHVHPDHVGGNAAIAAAAGTGTLRADGAFQAQASQPLKIIAHGNVLNRLAERVPNQPRLLPDEGMPEDQYFTPFKDLHMNGEAVFIYHEPNAHTDGDSVVLFRGSDVVVTGDIFTPGGYPFIDVDRGGSVQGEIAALNHILDLTVPAKTQEGGTMVVPGHGRICDEADVVEFRDMIVIVRDRVQDGIKKGMSLDQIKASRPTRDYDTEYVTANSFVKADQFVEAIYKSLTKVGAK
jgi:cyclase